MEHFWLSRSKELIFKLVTFIYSRGAIILVERYVLNHGSGDRNSSRPPPVDRKGTAAGKKSYVVVGKIEIGIG